LFSLDAALSQVGSRLIVLVGSPLQEIPAAARRFGADAVYAAAVYDPAASGRDNRIRKELSSQGIGWSTFKDVVVFEHDEVVSAAGQPLKVFTPYRKAWLSRLDQAPRTLPGLRRIHTPAVTGAATVSRVVQKLPSASEQGGEEVAAKKLKSFVTQGIADYRARREFPGVNGTSRLSAHLSHGTISIRRVLWTAVAARESAEKVGREAIDTFISELVWREFYYQILANFPHVARGSFRREFDALAWSENKRHFASWCEGQTGYPMVDAAMRQLTLEGWMHNRARMIVASFLTKDLHINWQWGEKYFLKELADGDIASNNGGWQWSAGTGTDASPWFRIFNPVTQGEKFDGDGSYVRKYVPELATLPDALIHKPWTMSTAEQQQYGVAPGKTYPRPIVDHAQEREITLHLYKHPGEGHRRLNHR